MVFEVIYAPRAKIEIFDALNFYFERSLVAAMEFDVELKYLNNALEINPFYEIKYKNVRAIPLKTFPYCFYFKINEDTKIVEVLSCFHTSQNPKKLPNS